MGQRLADRIRGFGLELNPRSYRVCADALEWEDDEGTQRGIILPEDLVVLRGQVKEFAPDEPESFVKYFISELRRKKESERLSRLRTEADDFLVKLNQAVVIAADNVWDYCADETRSVAMEDVESLPNVAPPFPLFFVEMKVERCQGRLGDALARMCMQRGSPNALGFLFEAYEPDWRKLEEIWEEARRKAASVPKDEPGWPSWHHKQFFKESAEDYAGWEEAEHVLWFRDAKRETSDESDGRENETTLPRWIFKCRGVAEFTGHKVVYALGEWTVHVDAAGHGSVQQMTGGNLVDEEVADIRQRLVSAGRWDPAAPMTEDDALNALHDDEKKQDVLEGDVADYVWDAIYPAMLTLAFMHTKNVAVAETAPPEKLSRAHARRRGHPLVRYKTLQIEPMQRVLRTEGGAGDVGIHQALHICRGHFKTFGANGLFGKHKGTYWWPSMVRGTQARAVVKDYDVGPNEKNKTQN
ncbi:hypothetical protein [Myxococcus xanthus]|uniref:hypothetical protein n=1 Tax=Myxococcus xanthus TaxID=34 RepID=UPI00112B0B68|nr:hypothetical protein [Myxococcus xanthus]